MSHWNIEIKNSSDVWVALDAGQVQSCTSGTGSESQIIPDFSIAFTADTDFPPGILDPELDRKDARLRITDGTSVRYFRIEKQPGNVKKALNYPTISGRAYAGIITELRPLSYDFANDITASDITRKACEGVGVVWLATEDPTIPASRWQISKKNRLELLKEVVAMCGAKLRVSEDGRYFEVYDHPAKALTDSATRVFNNPRSLNYEMRRVKQPGNAIRVNGEQANYTRPTLPVVTVSVSPTFMVADGTTTATATAKVYGSDGKLVQHKAIIDEAITAGSYTEIPVSGCYAVQAVWLNTGTAASPIKGSRITPTGFTASTITVPDNSTQLFIVSYTQAQIVSFNLSDQADEYLGEAQDTTGTLSVSTTNNIGRVIGVYRAGDIHRSGVNYYTGGSYTANTKDIILGITPGPSGTAVIIDYEAYNGAPLSASISPTSALCSASGTATATIGSGSTVGTAKITASALNVEGSCWLSLTGSAIDYLYLSTDKTQILVGSTILGQTSVNELNLSVETDIYSRLYIVVQNSIAGGVTLSTGLNYSHYEYTDSEHRCYVTLAPGFVSVTVADVTYNTTADVENTAGEATITADVSQTDGSPVTDGTIVLFGISPKPYDCSLSSDRVSTVDGIAETTLTAGNTVGTCIVSAMCGSQLANIAVDVVETITDDSGFETVAYPTGAATDDESGDSGTSGDIVGKRRLVCKDVPHVGITVTFDDGDSTVTDGDGWFTFQNGVTGTNTAYAYIDEEEYEFTWTCN